MTERSWNTLWKICFISLGLGFFYEIIFNMTRTSNVCWFIGITLLVFLVILRFNDVWLFFYEPDPKLEPHEEPAKIASDDAKGG